MKIGTSVDEYSFLSAAISLHLLEEKLLRESSIMKVVEDMLKPNQKLTAKDEAEAETSIQSLSELEHESEHQDTVTEYNNFRNKGTWTTDSTSSKQFSDSGYASMLHRSTRKSEYSQKETIMEEFYNIIAEPESNNDVLEEIASTDQADDRAVSADNRTVDADDRTVDIDVRTEYSAATSLGDSRIEGLVSQLADQLIGEIFSNDERSIKTVFNILQGLLKNFALKIGFNAQSQIQRDIMYYTHKYSR